jgi:hypothetical protein
MDIAAEMPDDAGIGGILVMVDYRDQLAYLKNLHTGTQTLLPRTDNREFRGFDVSPNRKWLAYTQEKWLDAGILDRMLVIATADGHEQQNIPVPAGLMVDEWLNNDYIVLSPTQWDGETINPITLLNPFTGQQQVLSPDYPDMYNFGFLLWGNYGSTRTIYDPTLECVLYPMFGTGDPSSAFDGIVLWDIGAKKVLAELPTMDGYGKDPQWSPNGEQVVIVTMNGSGLDEFISISRDGNIRRLSSIADGYDSLILNHYSWSPDGDYIAFLMSNSSKRPFTDEQFAILDTQTGHVTNYCHLGDYSSFSTPVWSPDGKQVVIGSYVDDLEHVHSVILVDIGQGWAAQITESLTPVGWMVGP